MNLVGYVINQKYILQELLAEGGMAFVYKARHIHLNDLCAVKIIKESAFSKDKILARFQREAQVTRQLAQSSPYIISIYDFGAEDKLGFYYVMELLNGYPLSSVLQDPSKPPPLAWVSLTIAHLCEALSVVHKAGLVHRDIKSDNVFIHRPPYSHQEVVKLLDFGLVRPIYMQETNLTTYGRVMGTPEYMSPEQCKGPSKEQFQQGLNHIDGRSDIYSLGVLLYQCLTGQVPFPIKERSASEITRVMAGHVLHQPPAPHLKRPDLAIPPAISEITMKAMSKKPEDRYPTMTDFRDALLHFYQRAFP